MIREKISYVRVVKLKIISCIIGLLFFNVKFDLKTYPSIR